MTIDIKRSIKAPFITDSEEGILLIYLIALGFSIGIFVIHFLFTILGIASTIFVCIIHIIHFIVVISTQSFQFGYFLETIKLEVKDSKSVMPAWNNNYARFFWNGIKFQVMLFIYAIISSVFSLIIYGACTAAIPFIIEMFSNTTSDTASYIKPALLSLFTLIISFIPLIFILFILFILPMACVLMASKDSILSSLNIWNICKIIIKNFFDYIIVYVLTIGLIIPVIIACILLCLTVIGWIGIGLIQFIFFIMIFNLFAQIYKSHTNRNFA